MTHGPTILVVDSGAADRQLIAMLFQRELPAAQVSAVGDALAFAEAIYTRSLDVAIVSDSLPWASVHDVVALIRTRHPRAVAIVTSAPLDRPSSSVDRGVMCDGWLLKSTENLLRLPQFAREVLDSRRDTTPAPQDAAPASHTSVASTRPAVARAETHTPGANGASPPGNGQSRRPAAEADTLQDVALLFSHDLREPLQQIGRLVRAKAPGESDVALATMLRRVMHCAERANSMLDAAVEYLTIERHAPERRPVDLNTCLRQALENLRIEIEESHAHVRAGELPVVIGDREQLVHVFQNLISNAIKFRGPEIPIVTIRCEERRHEYALVFRDNGIGIPAAHAERIFGVRTRLHSNDQIPGSGLGLALCRAIVERHGGHVTLEKGEALGATFIVTLPRTPDDVDDAEPPHDSSTPFERVRIDQ